MINLSIKPKTIEHMKKLLSALLIILAIIMIGLGFQMQMLAPALTGIGFIIISLLFYSKN